MKKVLFLLTMFMMVGVASNAQSCKGKKGAKAACCSKKAAAKASTDVKAVEDVKTTKVAAAVTEAEVIANQSEDIKVRKCAVSGTTSFYQKSVCEKSGSVSWDQVEFCSKSKKFTKVASASMEKDVETGEVKTDKKSCSKGASAKACCSKGAKKASCSKGDAKKGCCSKGAKAAATEKVSGK